MGEGSRGAKPSVTAIALVKIASGTAIVLFLFYLWILKGFFA